jgi:SAM-dependent methyltransferase
MAGNSLKSELRSTWELAAPGWAKWEYVFATGLSSATDALIDMAGIGPGMRVLDLACGAGSQSIQAARRVGPHGKVIASDISGSMLEYVRQNAARAGLHNIETLECAADELDETQPPFDASMCRLGLMLFPSPPKALETVRRVLKPGARFRGTGLYNAGQQSLHGAADGDPSAPCWQVASCTRATRYIRVRRGWRPGTPNEGWWFWRSKNEGRPGTACPA